MKIIKVFIKFGLVGASGVLVNMAIYSSLIAFDVNYLIASTIAFLFAVSSNFYLNFVWTFKGKGENKSVKEKYTHFFIISLINFVINLFVLKLAVESIAGNEYIYGILEEYSKLDSDKIIKIISQIIGIGIATFFNFFGNYFITFREKKEK